MSRISLVIAALFLVACFAASGCGGSGGQGVATAGRAPATPTPADTASGGTESSADPVASLVEGTMRDPMFETVLAPLHDVEVFARLDGQLIAVEAEVGQRIRQGDVLARLDDRDRRAVLEEREAEASRMEASWQRAQSLHDQGVISEREWIDARSDWHVAKARRDQAEVDHEWCTVRAPIDGVVALRRVQAGQLVKEDDLLFRVSNPDLLRAELLLPERYMGQVKIGHVVHLTPIAGGTAVDARVTHVSPIIDPGTGTMRVMIDFDNRRARIPAGMSVRVAFDPDLGVND